MRKRKPTAFLAIATAVLTSSAGALEYRLLHQEAALCFFSDDDLAMLERGVKTALIEAADGETRAWKNPATGNSVQVTPLASYARDELHCRRAHMITQSPKVAAGEGSVLDFCRTEGVWMSADIPPPDGHLGQPGKPGDDPAEG